MNLWQPCYYAGTYIHTGKSLGLSELNDIE